MPQSKVNITVPNIVPINTPIVKEFKLIDGVL